MRASAAALLCMLLFLPACERDEGIAEQAQPSDTVVAAPGGPEPVPGMEEPGPDAEP